MRKTFLMLAVTGFALSGAAQADVLVVPGPQTTVVTTTTTITSTPMVPTRGAHMNEVIKQFGEPSVRHPAKGGGKRVHPPITRWDYPSFSVFFERSALLDVVIAGAPAPITRVEELKPIP